MSGYYPASGCNPVSRYYPDSVSLPPHVVFISQPLQRFHVCTPAPTLARAPPYGGMPLPLQRSIVMHMIVGVTEAPLIMAHPLN